MLKVEGTELVEIGSLVVGDTIADVNGTRAIVERIERGMGQVCVSYHGIGTTMGNVLIQPEFDLIRKVC